MAINIPMKELNKVVYRGVELNELNIAGCKWRKPDSITFPSIPKTTVTKYKVEAGTGRRIFSTSKQTEYSGYSDYNSCIIDGIDVTGTSFVIVKQDSALDKSTIYYAKFTGGTLYIETYTQFATSNNFTSAILTAKSYSTTARFLGEY